MALDFPNAPTLNQTFTAPNGTNWLWDGVKWTAITSTSPFTGQGNVGRNLLHNPLFNVAQRGAGPWAVGYTVDRWSFASSLDTSSAQQFVAPDGTRGQIGDESVSYFMGGSVTGNAAAGSYTFLYQPVEDMRRIAGKTVTVSFWALANSGTPKLGIGITQDFGTGGSPSAAVIMNGQSVTVGTAWARYSVAFAIPSVIGKTLGTNNNHNTALSFWFSSGATQNVRAGNIGVQTWSWNIWGVQLEIGSVATPLEKPDPRYDLSNCQRFYQSGLVGFGGSASGAATNVFQTQPLAVQMRAVPTLYYANSAGSNITGQTVNSNGSPSSMTPICNVTAAGFYYFQGSFSASADL